MPEAIEEDGEADEILDPERAASRSHLDEDIGPGCVGPARRQGQELFLLIKEHHPLQAPGAAQRDEAELSAEPWVEGMGDADYLDATIVGIGCS
jgi:hypothetical protein